MRSLVRAIWLAPFYFCLLTVFAVWPWRHGSPWFLLGPLRLPDIAWRASVLRLVVFRLFFREKRLARPQGSLFRCTGRQLPLRGRSSRS